MAMNEITIFMIGDLEVITTRIHTYSDPFRLSCTAEGVFCTPMSSNHEIIITNYRQTEEVHYSVVIIKGHLKNKPKASCKNSLISLHLNERTLEFKVVNDGFKCLVELSSGQNTIDLSYCCSTLKFDLLLISKPTKFGVLPLYIICEGHDGRFQAPQNLDNDATAACKKVDVCCKILQSVIAEKLHEENLGRKTFRLERACVVFYSKLNYLRAREMSQQDLWAVLGRELVDSSLHREERKFLAFLSCTIYDGTNYKEGITHDEIVSITQAYVALGGGGLALFGTACFFTWPETISKVIEHFENSTIIDRTKFMDDSCYRGTYGTCYSTTLGSVLHELCHTFDLGHTANGIMGRGFDDIHKMFLNCAAKNVSTISLSYQTSIEFKEKLDSGLLSERLKDPKQKSFIKSGRNTKEEDNTFWTKSCTVILAYHKWLNNCDRTETGVIKFDPITRVVSSTKGLRVIEIRRLEDSMVLLHWIFVGKIFKYSFHVSFDDIKSLQESNSLILFAEDNNGNILKVDKMS